MDWSYEIPGKTLMDVAKICGAVVDDITLQVQKNGMLFVAVDASHVAMVAITIGEFDEKKEAIKLGIELRKLVDIINGHTKATKSQTDMVRLEYDMEKTILTVFAGDTTMSGQAIDIDALPLVPRMPNFEGMGMVKVKDVCPKKLSDAFAKQKRFGDLASVVLKKDGIDITTNTSQAVIKTHLDSTNEDHGRQSQFSLTYLKPFAERVKSAARVTLEIGENAPFLAEWGHDGINDNVGFEVKYFLAPRVESDY